MRTLYSRNGIKITKDTNRNIPQHLRNKFYSITKNNIIEEPKILDSGVHEMTLVSKLGFYYKTKQYVSTTKSKGIVIKYQKHVISIGNEEYVLEYPISYIDDNSEYRIDFNTRPWDILPGYKGMPDNMIKALYDETNKFLDFLMGTFKKEYKENYKEILIDLFGSENGPMVQQNEVKIVAHGFDPKISFRKRKES